MSNYKYNKETEEAWEDAEYCDCPDIDCNENSHRLCGISKDGTILYGSHESVESQKNSRFRWNIDHINPNGPDVRKNRQAAHVTCNQSKGNKY